MPAIIQYENSIAYNAVAVSTLEQLIRTKPYYENAMAYWKQQGDETQADFFEDGLRFVNKRIESCKSVKP